MKTSFRVKYAENYVFMFWKFTEYVWINIIKDFTIELTEIYELIFYFPIP